LPFGAADCEQSIPSRFAAQVTRAPESPAVLLATGSVSYAALHAAVEGAAGELLATSGEGTRPVALLADQGCEAIVWTLAILEAGHAFAPLDQRLPLEVLRAMVDDLGPAAIVATERHHGLARTLSAGRLPVLDGVAGTGREPQPLARRTSARGAPDGVTPDHGASTAIPHSPVPADRAACVFYTSGSTGTPKGVVDSHRNVLHNVLRYTNSLRFAPGDRLSLVQNPSFSGTVSSLLGALLNGATVVPYDLGAGGLAGLSDWVRASGVTVFHAVPSIFRELADPRGRFPSVRVVRLEGDRANALDVAHFRANFGAACTLVNGLGATECGLVRQFFVGTGSPAETSDPLPIGYPVVDMVVRVVDERGLEVPRGTIGEVVVESRYLALGYWRRPLLTARRFETLADGTRRYRTGDLGSMAEDGCLVHLGRADHAVRIAGQFVDTGAVERALLALPGVRQAIVGEVVDTTGESRLCAWLVRERDATVTADVLRAPLAERFGEHGAPAHFVFLEELPLTRDLKVDRSRLPHPGRARPALGNDLVLPASELERRLSAIWCEVLGFDAVGVTDSFFDLGGDSLRAVRVTGRIESLLGTRVSVAALFAEPTIHGLARVVRALQDPAGTLAA
jgi:amino acid adenylation domain-containing protein